MDSAAVCGELSDYTDEAAAYNVSISDIHKQMSNFGSTELCSVHGPLQLPCLEKEVAIKQGKLCLGPAMRILVEMNA